jgi:PAS domain S-box-containing protein
VINGAQEIFWMLDAKNMRLVYVNSAYETVTGRSVQSLNEGTEAFEEIVHPEDRERVLARWQEIAQTGRFDEEFRILRPDKTVLWVWVHGFPIRDSAGYVSYFTGTAQDVSARRLAEEQTVLNLHMAQSARAEAEALRNTSLALTQDLSMDHVLDTLLESLLKLIPCESARVLLLEDNTLFFTAREIQRAGTDRAKAEHPLTLDARNNRLLMHVLATHTAVLLSDTRTEPDWQSFPGHSYFHSWMCVPLVAAQRILGLLSLGHTQSGAFSDEHLRLAMSLAIPAAVAIQNARLYERAEIYSTELEQRLAELQQAREELQQAEQAAQFRRRHS